MQLRRRSMAAVVVSAVLGLGVLPAQAVLTTETFDAPGEFTFTVPEGVTAIDVSVFGSEGGSGTTGNPPGAGGLGGGVEATLTVTPGEDLTVQVGAFAGGVTPTRSQGGERSAILRGTEPLVVAGGGGGGGNGATDGDSGYDGTETEGGDGGPGGGIAPGGDGETVAGQCTGGGGGQAGAAGGAGGTAGTGANPGTAGTAGSPDGSGGIISVNGFVGFVAADGGDGAFGGGSGGNGGANGVANVVCGAGGGGGGSSSGPLDAVFTPGVQAGDGLVTITFDAPEEPGEPEAPEAPGAIPVAVTPTFTG